MIFEYLLKRIKSKLTDSNMVSAGELDTLINEFGVGCEYLGVESEVYLRFNLKSKGNNGFLRVMHNGNELIEKSTAINVLEAIRKELYSERHQRQ